MHDSSIGLESTVFSGNKATYDGGAMAAHDAAQVCSLRALTTACQTPIYHHELNRAYVAEYACLHGGGA
jgi:predicted outer membrane repeat protein